jgi:tetratricopeptide (TPR) repeat protein
MRIRSRKGTRLLAACGIFLLASVSVRAAYGDAIDAAGNPAPADGSLLADARAVLAHSYPGLDTNALLARIQERLKWGEKDERLIEAAGIIHADLGDYAMAIPCFKQLSTPGPTAMDLMAEALDARGEKYEAAEWRLRAARALPPADAGSVSLYRRYLSVRPSDARAELELAARLDAQSQFGEAGDLYWKRRDLLIRDTAAAARAADLLSVHGRLPDAANLIGQLLQARPDDKGLAARLAGIHEAMGDKPAAAAVWRGAWERDPADTLALRRALSLLEAAGPAGHEAWKSLLANAFARDSANPEMRYRMAIFALKSGDRKGAYTHLEAALRSSPGNPLYLDHLPEVIEGDSLIQAHAALLQERFGKEPASPRLALLAARAYSLAGDRANACQAWSRLARAYSPARRDQAWPGWTPRPWMGDGTRSWTWPVAAIRHRCNGRPASEAGSSPPVSIAMRPGA